MAAALLSRDENTVLICLGRIIIMSELLNTAALIYSHVVGLTSPLSFLIQLQSFIRLTSGDWGGHRILRLSLFSNHVNTTMALWQRTLSYLNINECCWSLNICSTGSRKFPSMGSMWECWLRFSSKTTKLPKPWMLMYPQTITETFLSSRNSSASGFILYPFFANISHVHHQSKQYTYSSESTKKDHLPLVLLCSCALGPPDLVLAVVVWIMRFFPCQ